MASVLELVSGLRPEFLTVRNAKMAYATVVGIGTAYGFLRGTVNWVKWLSERKQMKLKDNRFINADMVNPILNVGRDTGYLSWHAISSGVISGFIVATYPISVPALISFSDKEGEDSNTGDDE